eukprot:m.325649 g.325649  ORF g.325649 m.325649 type:complete len:51 (-) comp16472_c1_seq37:2299-2451(-)
MLAAQSTWDSLMQLQCSSRSGAVTAVLEAVDFLSSAYGSLKGAKTSGMKE